MILLSDNDPDFKKAARELLKIKMNEEGDCFVIFNERYSDDPTMHYKPYFNNVVEDDPDCHDRLDEMFDEVYTNLLDTAVKMEQNDLSWIILEER